MERRGIAFAGLVAASLLAIGGCDDPPQGAASPTGGTSRSKSKVAGAAEFATLAKALADPMLADGSPPAGLPSMDEVYAEANRRSMEFQSLATAPVKIAALAAEAAAAQTDFLTTHRSLKSANTGSGDGLLLLVGLVAGSPEVAFAGLQGSVQTGTTLSQLAREHAAAFQRNRGAQLSLASLAPEYAGPASDKPALLVDIDESWGGVTWPYDVVKLQNTSGKVLTNCLVQVSLSGNTGDKARNVHFVERWEPGTWRYARYGIGTALGSEQLGKQTVFGMSAASISIWSSELRSENIGYTYDGSERDNDIRAMFEGKVNFKYTLIDNGIINYVPALHMTLDGVPALPPQTVALEFHNGGDKITKGWEGQQWTRGESRVFQPNPRLPWAPESIQVTVSFSGTSYRWSQRVTMK